MDKEEKAALVAALRGLANDIEADPHVRLKDYREQRGMWKFPDADRALLGLVDVEYICNGTYTLVLELEDFGVIRGVDEAR